MTRLAAGRYEPFAMLAQIWGGSKSSTADDFNPYQIEKRTAPSRRARRVKLAEVAPLLEQFVRETGGK